MSKQEKQQTPISDILPVKVVKERRQREPQVKTDTKQLKELKLSWAGKLFFSAASLYIGSQAYKGYQASKVPKLPFKIKGNKQQIDAIMKALQGSAAFQREINRPGANIEQILNKLKVKNMNKQSFEKTFGVRWPL